MVRVKRSTDTFMMMMSVSDYEPQFIHSLTGAERAILVLVNHAREPLPALQRPIPLYYSGLEGSVCVSAFGDPSDELGDGNTSALWTRACSLDLMGRCTLPERIVAPASAEYFTFREGNGCSSSSTSSTSSM